MNRHAAALYRVAPVWAQNLMLSGFGSLLERERYGGRFREYQEHLAQTEWMSREELGAMQDAQLRDLVAHAYENVPYYRRRFDELKLKPSDIRGRVDLPKIPLLTRADIKTRFDELVSRNIPRRKVKMGHTSGTTGTPLTVGYDHECIWMTYAVFDRHYRWTGTVQGEERAAIARGNVIVPLAQREPPFWRFNRGMNQLLLSSFHLSKANLPAYVEALREFQPVVLDGYPSTLYVLAKYLQSRGEKFPLRAAITSSETLYDFQRAVIEDSFACRVFDYYALAERAVFSGECDHHRGHHVSMEYSIAEATDEAGLPVAPGSIGRLVGTNLSNRAMPLIRYATNDMSALRESACTCGRGLELMDDVTTKAEDLLTLKDGRLISPSVLTHPFKPLDCIEGSQIVQTAPDAVTVRLIPGKDYTEAHTPQLVSELSARLGEEVRLDVQFVDALEVSPNGKFKWVISRVPLGI